MQEPNTDLEINARAQLSILEACRKYNPAIKIVFASTRQIYGKPDYLPVDERHLLRPTDVNGINKMAGEWYHILYNNVYGIRGTSLRLTNTYGPRQYVKDARMGFIGYFIRKAVLGEEIVHSPITVQVQFRYAVVADAEGLKVLDVTDLAQPKPMRTPS